MVGASRLITVGNFLEAVPSVSGVGRNHLERFIEVYNEYRNVYVILRKVKFLASI